jgi:hypothetical protein
MDTLQVGLLLPNSSIFPISKLFQHGLNEGFREFSNGRSIELIPEFIGHGHINKMETAINKLIHYDNVDLITGIISNKAAENFSSRLLSKEIPFIINNLGENIPVLNKLNQFMFTCSFGLWQHAFTMGYWGVKNFGKNGMYISSIYDAGYSFSEMFHLGMKAADPNCNWSFSVAPTYAADQLADVHVIFPYLEQYQPDFIFATFCGAETTMFLREFINRGWHKRTKILALPVLLDPFQPLPDDITIYTTLPSLKHSIHQTKDCFYFAGVATANMISEAANKTGNMLTNLQSHSEVTTINNTHFVQYSTSEVQTLAIIKNNITATQKQFESIQIDEVTTYPINSLPEKEDQLFIGWNNPYLCV